MKRCIITLAIASIIVMSGAIAQDAPSVQAAGSSPMAIQDNAADPSGDAQRTFSQQELEQMVAPIALYPDSLLSQILMASTYPLEVEEAARWDRDHPPAGAAAEDRVQAVDGQPWDPSVKSLLAFPQVLQTMDRKMEWTESLGDAFLGQESQVMDAVQELRRQARRAGNLQTDRQVRVQEDGAYIAIEPVSPEVVYVPYYDPTVVYGPWRWSAYPPVYWDPWAGYGRNRGLAWGVGITVRSGFFFGGWDWRHHRSWIYDHRHRFPGDYRRDGRRPWRHDPGHRRGVPYHDRNVNRQFGRYNVPNQRDGQRNRTDRQRNRMDQPGNRTDRQRNRMDQPGNRTDRQRNRTDQPGNRTDRQRNRTDQPGSRTDQPRNRLNQPGSRTDQPRNRLNQPGSRTDQPRNRLNQPGSRTDQPRNRLNQPGSRTDQPGNRLNQPGNRTNQPGNRLNQPGGRTNQPGNRLNQQPVRTNQQPLRTNQQPIRTNQQPVRNKPPVRPNVQSPRKDQQPAN